MIDQRRSIQCNNEVAAMTPEQVKLIQQSFAQVAPIADKAAEIFYGRLFEVAPAVRSMFPADCRINASC
jgi:hypothetical protein